MMKAAFFNDDVPWMQGGHAVDLVYAKGRRQRLEQITDLYPEIISTENLEEHLPQLKNLEVIFSTWGMVPLREDQLERLPNLKAVFHAAGATSHFRAPFETRGITMCSGTRLQAVSVAEFALGQVLLAGKGYFRNSRECVDAYTTAVTNNYRGRGNYESRVSIIGNGSISQKLQEFLEPHDLEVVVVPSFEEERAVSLQEAFSSSIAIVNLLPDCGDNAGVFNAELFSCMMDSAVFINVGRGRQVNEADLIQVMKERPYLTALLDVQWPEPPVDGSPLYTMPNICLSGHIAGSTGNEFLRLSTAMIEEFIRFEQGKSLRYEVQPGQL